MGDAWFAVRSKGVLRRPRNHRKPRNLRQDLATSPFLSLADLTTLRDQLKAGLSATANEPGKEQGPSASELAEGINAMKAANSVEAARQRVGQRQTTAEEPITRAIRRRGRLDPSYDPSVESPASNEEALETLQTASAVPSSEQWMTFHERVLRDRQPLAGRPSLP